ncbi:MAG TPA: M12 family metallo-peptidase [Planctomycetota bacterium]|nr:M12 family metallo-peptidase [Planctomycetota bacterium]
MLSPIRVLTALSVLLFALPAWAQAPANDALPFPFVIAPNPGYPGTLEVQAAPGALQAWMGRTRVQMTDVPLVGRGTVTLDLERIAWDASKIGVQVNGQETRLDSGDLTLWKGVVVGDPSSDVFLGLSSYGSYGWVYSMGEYEHWMAFLPQGSDWSQSRVRLVPERVLQSLGAGPPPLCQTDTSGIAPPAQPSGDWEDESFGGQHALGITRECKVAIETDFEYYQIWNNISASYNYTQILLAALSDRYRTQVDVVLTYPYLQFYTNANDPWTAQPGGAGAMLDEFRNAWSGNLPGGANLAHFLSGADLGGGVAYLDVLCNPNFGFGVSGNLSGGTQFPVVQSSNTWDFYVVAHELGHNFGTVHTHDYCPPIDQCADTVAFGACQTQRVCISNGTIMSYCHTCTGGMNNIDPHFHPTVVQAMEAAVDASCLVNYCASDVAEPNDSCGQAWYLFGPTPNLTICSGDLDYFTVRVDPGVQTTFTLDFDHSLGNIDCRLSDDTCFQTLDVGQSLTNQESVTWTNASSDYADLKLEVYLVGPTFSNEYTLNMSSVNLDPCQGNPDNLEPNNQCFGASGVVLPSGFYPNLNVSQADPDLMGVVVPAGATTYVDANFDHSMGDINLVLRPDNDPECGMGAMVSNAYATALSTTDNERLSWTNTTGASVNAVLEVFVSNAGPGIVCNDYEMILRNGIQQPGTTFCDPMDSNSTGEPTVMFAIAVGGGPIQLEAIHGPPGQFASVLVGTGVDDPGVVLGSGRFCLALQTPNYFGRYNIFGGALNSIGIFDADGVYRNLVGTSQGGHGYLVSSLPFVANPNIQLGDTWHFQLWHRENAGGSNFSNGLTHTF